MISGLFKTKTADGYKYARRYLEGLLTETPRKNMERIDERLEGGDYESMQNFISSSPWDEMRVYEFVARRADERLGGRPETILTIDESGFSKKGKMSVGVARQYNGRLGKQDNCQVGVFSTLNCGDHSALVGSRLFLPQQWVEDRDRCLKAGVPEEKIVAHTKIDLARELVDQAQEHKMRFTCVSFDAFYGRDSGFLRWLDEKELIYCGDLPADTLMFDKRPLCAKRPEKMRQAAGRVDDLAERFSADLNPTSIPLREGENGLVQFDVWAVRVWVWPAAAQEPLERWLIVSRDEKRGLKYSISNAPGDTPIERLASWQRGRYFVERTFQDGKSHAGMAQYQARGWNAWRHHMALVALALLFMMEQRLLLSQTAPLLSASDLVELLDWHLTSYRSKKDVIEAIENRHRQRELNALNAQNRARRRIGLPALVRMAPKKIPK